MAHPLKRGLGALLLAALVGAGPARAQTALPPDETRTLGQRVADATFVDEQEAPVELASLAGAPLVVSPIFTKCHHTCPMITANLKRAVEQASAEGESFRVLSLTFDQSDTAADLRGFRERLGLPEDWYVVRGPGRELHAFLESIDFHFITNTEAGFIHPNLVVVLTPDLKVAKYLYGVEYRPDDLRGALALARGEAAPLQSLGPYLFVVGVLGVLVSSFFIALVAGRSRRKARGG